jgi:hypothetical protein
MESEHSVEALSPMYETRQRQILEDSNLNLKYSEIADFVKCFFMWKI